MLQCHPDIQDKLYHEVVAEVGTDRAVNLDDKENLPYCRAVVEEILRYSTVAILGLPHTTREDTQLSGIPVPRGTQVSEELVII